MFLLCFLPYLLAFPCAQFWRWGLQHSTFRAGWFCLELSDTNLTCPASSGHWTKQPHTASVTFLGLVSRLFCTGLTQPEPTVIDTKVPSTELTGRAWYQCVKQRYVDLGKYIPHRHGDNDVLSYRVGWPLLGKLVTPTRANAERTAAFVDHQPVTDDHTVRIPDCHQARITSHVKFHVFTKPREQRR